MGLASVGGTGKLKGAIATAYFINTMTGTYPRSLVVNDSLFESVEIYGYTFRAVAKSSFKVKYTVSDYSVMRSVIVNENTKVQTVLSEGAVYTFEKGIRYTFGYSFTQTGNGTSFSVGKTV